MSEILSQEETIKQLADKPVAMQRVGDPLIDNFREMVLKRAGRSGFRGLVRVLRSMDNNGDKKLSLKEIEEGLEKYGLSYRPEEMERLFRWFDKDKSGSISVTEFIRGVRPAMSMARRDFVMQAYGLIDANADGVVKFGDVVRLYDFTRHPDIIAGKKKPEEVYEEFVAFWDKDGDGVVTKDEFLEYYSDISAGIDSDVYFELMIRNAWHISGGDGAAKNTTCLRVLVKYEDGRQQVVEVKNDLGLKSDDVKAIRKRLEKQGVKHIAEVKLTG